MVRPVMSKSLALCLVRRGRDDRTGSREKCNLVWIGVEVESQLVVGASDEGIEALFLFFKGV